MTNFIYLSMVKKLLNLKLKIKYAMCLGDLSKNNDTNSRKNTGLYGNIYDFSVGYSAITNKIIDIHNYLMK